jgi:hypothetical protein
MSDVRMTGGEESGSCLGTSDGEGKVLAEATIIVISVDSAAGMPAH